jgi:uncharacterized membrane protein HdeD (DUF308 family)
MGKNSRKKLNRKSAPPARFNSAWPLLSQSTMLFVVGIAIIAYGTAAFQYTRWNRDYNRAIHPSFHPWAIVVGVILVYFSSRKSKGQG